MNMKRSLPLLILTLFVITLTGCDVLLRWEQPVVIEIPYRSTVDGYVSISRWNDRAMVTSTPNHRSSYRPLSDARVTFVETGHVTRTDRYGYFSVRVPAHERYITLRVDHWRLREPLYTSIHLK